MTPPNPSNPVIVISAGDNVATALEALEPGRVLTGAEAGVTVRDAIPRGHKVALARIAPQARMTGSGACVFASFGTEEAARGVLRQLPETMQGFVAQGLDRHPLYEYCD